MAASAGLGSYNTVLIRVDYDGCWREELLLILQDFQSANPGLSFEDDSVIDSHLAPWLALQAHKLKHIQPRYPILADMVSQIEQSGARYVYVGQFSNRQSYKTDLSASGKYLGVAKENQGFRYYEYNNKGTLNVAKISSVQALKLLWKFLQALLTPGADNLELKTVKLFPFLILIGANPRFFE